jgi:FkbM family methyltransferase
MVLIRKIKTGFSLLFNEGPAPFLRALKQNIFPSNNPDEVLIAFNVLNAEKEKGVMMDVGAHHGHSLASFANHNWQVYAFEPDSDNRHQLETRFGNFPDVNIDPRALSDSPQEKMTLYKSVESSGISGLSLFHSSHTPAEEVEVTTLKHFLSEKNITDAQIDFLKIDTEGFDLFVLKGFPWKKNKPRLIICEFEDKKTVPLGYNYHDLAQYLTKLGYQIIVSEWCPIKKYGGPHDWKCFSSYPHKLNDKNSWGNLIAVIDEKLLIELKNSCGI